MNATPFQLFMANAPTEIPGFFRSTFVFPACPSSLSALTRFGGFEGREYYEQWLEYYGTIDDDDPQTIEYDKFRDEDLKRDAEIKQWELDYNKSVYFAWRVYYAEQMCAAYKQHHNHDCGERKGGAE